MVQRKIQNEILALALPIAFIFAAAMHLGIIYVWSVMVLDWVARMVIILARYHSERWQEIRLVEK
ncbi:MAG: hypothetical protein L0Y56_03565 [Nitrospira sp.]|nr:hypothetical protein [Nitrospira sp.]